MKVAVIHEWLTTYAGSERVLEQILLLFPESDLFTLIDDLPANQRGFLCGKKAHTTYLQVLPFRGTLIKKLLWLTPSAAESLDLSSYNLVISSSHAVAKGVITGPDQLHICYCHSPMRYAWDLQHEYLRQAGLSTGFGGAYARLVLHYMRIWDTRTANGVDHFIANSDFIGRRIKKTYGRSAKTIHPPVDTDVFQVGEEKDDYFLTVSRLVPYKRVDLLVDAFKVMPEKRLVVIGDGPQLKSLKQSATRNVTFLGYLPDNEVKLHMQRARAFLFAAQEDFGIVLVEAQACGTPVICLGSGGAVDIVSDGITGVLFEHQSAECIVEAVSRFELLETELDSQVIRDNSERFSIYEFRKQFAALVEECYAIHETGKSGGYRKRAMALHG